MTTSASRMPCSNRLRIFSICVPQLLFSSIALSHAPVNRTGFPLGFPCRRTLGENARDEASHDERLGFAVQKAAAATAPTTPPLSSISSASPRRGNCILIPCLPTKNTPPLAAPQFSCRELLPRQENWRRDRDSNPGYPCEYIRLSKAARSTAPASLRQESCSLATGRRAARPDRARHYSEPRREKQSRATRQSPAAECPRDAGAACTA